MKFLSASYFRRGKNSTSLLLQQYRYKQAQMIFACLCAGKGKDGDRAGGYMAEQLLQWFRGMHVKKLFKNQDKSMIRLTADLYGVIRRLDRELEDSGMAQRDEETSIAGMICLEDRYMALHRGEGCIRLINTAFGRGHIQNIIGKPEEGGLCIEQGMLQPGIGLLLAMKVFYACIGNNRIMEGLALDEAVTEEQMDRHLRELAKEGERQGNADMSAILLRTCLH